MRSTVRMLSAVGAVLGMLVVAGCGISNEKLDSAAAKIDSLMQQGVPDSLLTDAKVQLMQARTGLRTGNTALAGQNADAMYKLIAAADAWYAESQTKLGPEVRSRREAANETVAKLTGPQKQAADSLLAIIDKQIASSWMAQASAALNEFDTVLVQLVKDEERMAEVLKKLPGVWGEQAVTPDRNLNAVRTKRFVFGSDGSIMLDEKMVGKSGPELKEDWQYVSQGTWSVKGDTVFVAVGREKRVKQVIENLVNGKWVKQSEAPYDSAITDGSKNLFVTFSYMEENMKKLKK
jgi:hypothetical protein